MVGGFRRVLTLCLICAASQAWGQYNWGFGGTTASTEATTSSPSSAAAAGITGGALFLSAVFAVVWTATAKPPPPVNLEPATVVPSTATSQSAPTPPAQEDAPTAPATKTDMETEEPPPVPSAPSPPPLQRQDMETLRLKSWEYVRPNLRQLQLDLAAGAGRTISDLAALAGIPAVHEAHFGRLLRSHSRELANTLALNRPTPDSAAAFFLEVGRIGWADPVIAADVRRALAAVSTQPQAPAK